MQEESVVEPTIGSKAKETNDNTLLETNLNTDWSRDVIAETNEVEREMNSMRGKDEDSKDVTEIESYFDDANNDDIDEEIVHDSNEARLEVEYI